MHPHMDIEAWKTLNQLVERALDLPPSDRTTWVEDLGPEYEAFKPRLRVMLERLDSTSASEFLESLPTWDDTLDASPCGSLAARRSRSPRRALSARARDCLGRPGRGVARRAHRRHGRPSGGPQDARGPVVPPRPGRPHGARARDPRTPRASPHRATLRRRRHRRGRTVSRARVRRRHGHRSLRRRPSSRVSTPRCGSRSRSSMRSRTPTDNS